MYYGLTVLLTRMRFQHIVTFAEGITMKKTPISLFGLALLLFALSAPAVYAQVQTCENDQVCDNGRFCDGVEACVWSESEGASICLPGSDPCAASETCVEDTEECVAAAGCEDDDDCDDGVFCNGAEMCADGECFSAGDPCADNQQEPFCNEDKNLCVECRTSIDCFTGEICSLNMCVDESECVLIIKPKKVHINKMFRPAIRRFRIKGGEGFDPRAAIDFGPLDVRSAAVNRKGVLKVLATIPAGKRISRGPVRVSVGECVGEILLK